MADFPSPAGFIADLDQGSPTNADRVFGSDDYHRNIRETMVKQFPKDESGGNTGWSIECTAKCSEVNTLTGINTGSTLESRIAAIESQLSTLESSIDRIGRIVAWPINETDLAQTLTGSLAPGQGTWHWCDGTNLDGSTTYSSLYTIIKNQFGGTDAASMLIPKILGRVIAGRGTGNDLTGYRQGVNDDTQGNTGGEQSHVQTTGELRAHNHPGGNVPGANQTGSAGFATVGAGVNVTSGPINVASQGSSEAMNVVQPTIILAFYIRVL